MMLEQRASPARFLTHLQCGKTAAHRTYSLCSRSADGSDDEEESSANFEVARRLALEQLCAAMRFPAAGDATQQRVLRLLAVHALFGPPSGKALAKCKVPELAEAAKASPPLSDATRELCACRLVAMLAAAANAAAAAAPHPAAQGKGKKKGDAGAAGAPFGAVCIFSAVVVLFVLQCVRNMRQVSLCILVI